MKLIKLLYFTKKGYEKAKDIYSKKRNFIPITPIQEINEMLGLPSNVKWYQYKGRIFIFRRWHSIASFVITKDKIYRPLEGCGAIMIDRLTLYISYLVQYGKEFKLPLFIALVNIFRDYRDDMRKSYKFEEVKRLLSENGNNLSHN